MLLPRDAKAEGLTQRGDAKLISKRRMAHAALFFCIVSVLIPARVTAADAPGVGAKPVTIPFELRRGHVMVPVTLNGTNRISMLLDTGYGMTMLRESHAGAADLQPTGRSITIVGIAGEERAKIYEGPEFGFSGWTWKPRRVAAFPEERVARSQRRDGVLGSGFFRRYVVEIDPARKHLVLHEPAGFSPAGEGEVLPLTFQGTTPIVETMVKLPDGSEVRAAFEVDTGCDGALCIGKHFVEQHRLGEVADANGNRVGVGGRTPVREGHLPLLRLGKLAVERPAANFFMEGAPADAPLAGHIGWELLKEFRVIFDYSRKRMLLSRR